MAFVTLWTYSQIFLATCEEPKSNLFTSVLSDFFLLYFFSQVHREENCFKHLVKTFLNWSCLVISRHVNWRLLRSEYVASIESISLPANRIRRISLQYFASTNRILSISLQFFNEYSPHQLTWQVISNIIIGILQSWRSYEGKLSKIIIISKCHI